MKISSISLQNFKRFKDKKEISFISSETNEILDLIVIVGNNGNGKSTILQAIASMIGTATRRLNSPEELEWEGFNYELISAGRIKPAELSIEVSFSKDEVKATQEYYNTLAERESFQNTIKPSNTSKVKLNLDYPQRKIYTDSPEKYFQFRGYEYAKQLAPYERNPNQLFDKVGNIFWYTEHRNSTSLTLDNNEKNENKHFDLNTLRRRLSDWATFHQKIDNGMNLREGQRDFYKEIETLFKTVFSDRSFVGIVPNMSINGLLSEPWFYLQDNANNKLEYEISEMSGGERALFPILMDFANWRINNSIILIDEIELHLHPPLQQTLLHALSKLGKNNQFIITTHSDYIASMVSKNQIIYI